LAGAFAKDPIKDPEEIGKRDVGKGVNFYSLEQEIALGKQMVQDVETQSRALGDPVITEFVNRIGQNLARNSDAKVPLTIKLLDSEEVNAFALPGGFFFVNSGLILKADSEAELAGVMAHEIAHVAARHGTKQATRAQIVNLATTPLIFMGGWTGFAIRLGVQLAIPVGFLQFAQVDERQADFLGLQYVYKCGYDPNSFVDFFEKVQSMEKKKSGMLSKAFSTHPMTTSRIKAAQKEIETILIVKPQYVVNTSEFDDVKGRLTKLYEHRRLDSERWNRPQLRHRPGAGSSRADDRDHDNSAPGGHSPPN
jgi:predicted Zn-dependent protease